MINRALGVVAEIVESVGLDVSYAYEDLIFLEHPDAMLQFTDSAELVLVHINEEAEEENFAVLLSKIQKEAAKLSMIFRKGRCFRINQSGEETVTIEFLSPLTSS
jgi:hypothetical protein